MGTAFLSIKNFPLFIILPLKVLVKIIPPLPLFHPPFYSGLLARMDWPDPDCSPIHPDEQFRMARSHQGEGGDGEGDEGVGGTAISSGSF